jgi:ATP phosphoribosyltransferase regulatory subunit
MKKDLLHTPEGVRDIYSTECAEKKVIENRLHDVCASYGYNDIQTPSIEFFDVFNKERGSVPSNEMFKLFDRYGNTLVLRPDMTPSIARATAKYFEDRVLPVKLCKSF